jgi:predicted ATPase
MRTELQVPEDIAQPEVAPTSTQISHPSPPPPTVALTSDMRVTLLVKSYRALRDVRWPLPRGVSALVGPNGSGKTTLLDVPELLRHALTHDARKAIDDRGGPGTLRSLQAERDAPVIVGVEIDQLAWQLDLSPRGAAFNPLYGERATIAGALAFDRSTANTPTDDARPLLRRFADLPEGAPLRPLVTLLQGYRLYGTYDLAGIRVNGSQLSSDEHLHPDGRNIFSLLRNWRDRKETRSRWDFVLASLKAAFPDTFDDLDFDMAGQTVSGRIVAPEPDVRIPTYFAANGWLVALLHLAAVASTGPSGVVAIDEMENGLHPYAIRALIEAMRSWAEQTGISVVLATHSPVVLDQFKDAPDHVFVMEPGREPAPTRLDELHDPGWLAHFSLGDLYAHDEFGAQHKDGDQVA